MATKTDKKWKALLVGFFFRIRNNDFVYRKILNRKYRYAKSISGGQALVQERIVDDLEKFGVALARVSEFSQFEPHAFAEMESWIKANEVNLKQKDRKKFLFSYYGSEDSEKPLDLRNPIVSFFLQQSVLEIVCSYLGYVPQLYEVYIEKTMPIGMDAPTFSQNWHRDPEERRTLKVFLYLNDVSQESGPFTYVRGSAPTSRGPYSNLFPQDLPHGCYPSEQQVKDRIRQEDMLSMEGGAGTVIFCDTAGLHKGGHATSRHRIMATAYFPSKYYSLPRRFSIPNEFVVKEAQLSDLAAEILDV